MSKKEIVKTQDEIREDWCFSRKSNCEKCNQDFCEDIYFMLMDSIDQLYVPILNKGGLFKFMEFIYKYTYIDIIPEYISEDEDDDDDDNIELE